MRSTRIIEDAVRRVNEALPVDEIGEDLRRNVAEVVGATLSRMNIVTREELEGHLEMLAEAEARMEALEERIKAIESETSGPTTAP